MSSDINTKTNIPPDAEVRDKAAASQEEIYLEEIEEEVRATLTTDDPSQTQRIRMSDNCFLLLASPTGFEPVLPP